MNQLQYTTIKTRRTIQSLAIQNIEDEYYIHDEYCPYGCGIVREWYSVSLSRTREGP